MQYLNQFYSHKSTTPKPSLRSNLHSSMSLKFRNTHALTRDRSRPAGARGARWTGALADCSPPADWRSVATQGRSCRSVRRADAGRWRAAGDLHVLLHLRARPRGGGGDRRPTRTQLLGAAAAHELAERGSRGGSASGLPLGELDRRRQGLGTSRVEGAAEGRGRCRRAAQ